MTFNRRAFLQGLAGTTVASGLGRAAQTSLPAAVPSVAPHNSGIEHIVVVTMENRSFDHFLGWLPHADGKQAGLSYTDRNGASQSTYWLGAPPHPDYEGCGHHDPDHSYNGSRICYAGGAMSGFLQNPNNDAFTIGYYQASDIPFYASLAQAYTAYDRWHAAILGPTFPNRFFGWSAQTDRLGDDVSLSSLPTIFDRLAKKGVSHTYYFNNLPFLSFWGLKYIFSTSLFSSFLAAAGSGTLPAVSFVDPVFTILDDGTANDDHPHADIRNGDAFLAKIFHAVSTGPKWSSTVLIINWDEWGGFFEHKVPPRVVAPNTVDPDLVNGAALLGFRVPTVIASPFTRGVAGQPNRVDSGLYDHTAALKLIEWRWNLPPLTARDASTDIGNPAASFNFTTPDATVPTLPQPLPVFATPCFQGGIFSPDARTTAALRSQPQTEFASLAAAPHAQAFLNHPRFRDALKGQAQ